MPSKAKAKKATVRNVKRSAKPQSKAVRMPVKQVTKASKTARKSATKHVSVRKVAAKKPVAKVINQPAKKPVVLSNPTPVKQTASKPAAVITPIRQTLPLKAETPKKQEYKVGHYVVYPTHGVGKILAEETQKVGDVELRVFVISFEKDKMTLRVPVHRAAAAGLRNVSSNEELQKAFVTLKGRARAARGMWSRRAQEYEAKINSGNILSVAEVVRDLHRNVDQAERSYSERMIYESALGRLVGELAAVEATSLDVATDKLMKVLKAQAA